MFISRGTVKSHLSRAYDKLGVTGRMQLMLLLQDSGMPGAHSDGIPSGPGRSGQVADVLGAARG
jgi:hypothetical protein